MSRTCEYPGCTKEVLNPRHRYCGHCYHTHKQVCSKCGDYFLAGTLCRKCERMAKNPITKIGQGASGMLAGMKAVKRAKGTEEFNKGTGQMIDGYANMIKGVNSAAAGSDRHHKNTERTVNAIVDGMSDIAKILLKAD